MKVPRLKADEEFGDGEVHLPPDWKTHSPLLRLDVLADWLDELTAAYNEAFCEFQKELQGSQALADWKQENRIKQ